MEIVAHHLQREAISRAAPADKDLFGRSSYNRYYYATFLHARAMVGQLRTEWQELPHADYPPLLQGKIQAEISKGRLKAQKIGDADTVALCNRAVAACKELSALMSKGSAIRVIADYKCCRNY